MTSNSEQKQKCKKCCFKNNKDTIYHRKLIFRVNKLSFGSNEENDDYSALDFGAIFGALLKLANPQL